MSKTLIMLALGLAVAVSGCSDSVSSKVPEQDSSFSDINWSNYSDNQSEVYKINSIVDIQDWNRLFSVEQVDIQGKEAKATLKINDYSTGSVQDCSLKPAKVDFESFNDRYEMEGNDFSWGKDAGLCEADKITLTHTSDNVYPHPDGLMKIRFVYKEDIKLHRDNQTVKKVRIHQGQFNIQFGGDSQ